MAVHVIGLTGGIASGKSTVARMLAERGAAIVDADQLARQVVEPGQPALAELVARFGAQILAHDGTLDRKRLGAIAFSDPAARGDLGRITHPRIAAASAAAIGTWTDAGANVVFYEAALLVENRAHAGLAALIVVAASTEVQISRVMARDGLTADEARARIAAQLPLANKVKAATWVIENDGEPQALAADVNRVVAEIEARFGKVAIPPRRVRKNEATGKVVLTKSETVLVTGFPSFTARRMLARLMSPLARAGADAPLPPAKVFVLAGEKHARDAAAFVATLPQTDRIEVLVGDARAMDLGLSSSEYRAVVKEVTWIHHLAGAGDQNVLDLARDAAGLERVVVWSNALVASDRRGIVRESDAFDSERAVVSAMRSLPITIIRPGIIVGDSKTGELDRSDGAYDVISLLATRGDNVRMPLLAVSDSLLHLVPIDYAIDAAWHVVRSDTAAGKTFHIVDPAPLQARAVVDAVSELAKATPQRGLIPRLLAREVLPAHGAHYDHSNTDAALAGTGLSCPTLPEILPTLVACALDPSRMPARPSARALDETLDPLD